jgi:hypothetical protein
MRRLGGMVRSEFVIRTSMDAVHASEELIARAKTLLDDAHSQASTSKAYRQLRQVSESLHRLERALAAAGPYERRRRTR